MELLEAVKALAGGVLIGTAASVLLLCNGRIAGISGIAAGLHHRTARRHLGG